MKPTEVLNIVMLAAAVSMAPHAARGGEPPRDPLQSVQWETMYRHFLDGQSMQFDARVKVLAPQSAEDSLQVPIMVDATALSNVDRIRVFADLNPLPEILEFVPGDAAPRIGFRIKVQQATPVRAAALTADGVWHVGGVWVDSAGGGCTLPSVGSGNADWASRLGQMRGRIWQRTADRRVRFEIMHPMDTGLAAGIPVFYIDRIDIEDRAGRSLATIRPFEPVSENPIFSLDLPGAGPVRVSGHDNNGNRFAGTIPFANPAEGSDDDRPSASSGS